MLAVFLTVRFFGHPRKTDFGFEAGRNQNVPGGQVPVDESGFGEMFHASRQLMDYRQALWWCKRRRVSLFGRQQKLLEITLKTLIKIKIPLGNQFD